MIRYLTAEEIECRVATISDKGCSLLLYKDARCDQNILDEEYGKMNWQKSYELIDNQLFCRISIWDEVKKMWISKQDVGVESYTEAEKGRASDAQKRACFCWGIGRELYTAPFIWIKAGDVNIADKNGKKTTYDKFSVKAMDVVEGKITYLEIYNENLRKVVYTFGKSQSSKSDEVSVAEKTKVSATKVSALKKKCVSDGVDPSKICNKCKVGSLEDLTEKQFAFICATWTENFVNGN